MRKKSVLLILLVVFCNQAVFAVEQGDPIGSPFMDVQAISNGDDTGTGSGPPKAQCVDLAKDFAESYHFMPRIGIVDCAANMWILLLRDYGYIAYEDGSSIMPKVGDLIIWWQDGWDCTTKYGHVAIVCEVQSGGVLVFEQNVEPRDDPYRWIPRDMSAVPNWSLQNGEGLGGSYYVKGWLRYPGFKVPLGMYFDGSYDQKIKDKATVLASQGKSLQGYDDGASPFVHPWEPFGYPCQNVKVSNSLEQGLLIYDHELSTYPYLISGEKWGFYRNGVKEGDYYRYGPDIPMGNGTTFGVPTSDEHFDNQMHAGGHSTRGSVKIHRPDGTLVYTYNSTGEFSRLTVHGQAVSQNHNVIEWLGGPACYKYEVWANGIKIGETTLLEFTEAGLNPGDIRTYQVMAVDENGNVLATSNEVTVISPGEPGSITLLGVADGHNGIYIQWDNTQFPEAPFTLVFVNGIQIAKSATDSKSIWPLEPNTTYKIQVAEITASNMILGWSNEIEVTTKELPPPPLTPDPEPTSIQIHIETVWEFGTDGFATATVYDQYGNEMSSVEVLFISTDSQDTFAISAESGYCLAHGIGTVEVWVEVKDNREIKSNRITVTVTEALPVDPPDPIEFPPSQVQLDQDFEVLSGPPYVEGGQLMIRVHYSNPTNDPITFYGPKIITYREDGSIAYVSSSSSISTTLNPGESGFYLVSGVRFYEPGRYFFQAYTCPVSSPDIFDWEVIEQTAPGVSNTLWIDVISEADLRSELQIQSFTAWAVPFTTNDSVGLRVLIRENGDLPATPPFDLVVSIVGHGSQTIQVPAMAKGDVLGFNFDFGPLPAGSYKVDVFVDPLNVVDEYNEGDNTDSLIVEVSSTPGLVVAPQVSDTTIVRDYNDSCGPYQDDRNTSLGIYTREGIDRFGRGLLDFDLSELPPNSKVDSAYVYLFHLGQGEYVGNDFHLNLLAEMFDPSFVDWCSRDSQNSWQNPGGTWTNFGQASVFIPSFYTGGWHYQSGEVNQWFTWDVTQMIQAVMDGQLEFNGFILRQEDIPNRYENQSVNFASMDHLDPELRPRLVIQYSDAPPEPPADAPDLTLRRARISSSSINVLVRNYGQSDSGTFNVRVEIPELEISMIRRYPSIANRSISSVNFPYSATSSETITFQITIDVDGEVLELNEDNNYFEEQYTPRVKLPRTKGPRNR